MADSTSDIETNLSKDTSCTPSTEEHSHPHPHPHNTPPPPYTPRPTNTCPPPQPSYPPPPPPQYPAPSAPHPPGQHGAEYGPSPSQSGGMYPMYSGGYMYVAPNEPPSAAANHKQLTILEKRGASLKRRNAHGHEIVRVQPVERPPSYIVLSCFVFWCFNMLFGSIAFIIAWYSKLASDENRMRDAEKLGWSSLCFSVAGIIISVVASIVIVCYVLG